MAIHPRDRAAHNPRVQCSVCGQWKRQYGKKINRFNDNSNFYGSCSYPAGRCGDHLAGDRSDVCVDCCDTECKRLAEQLEPAI